MEYNEAINILHKHKFVSIEINKFLLEIILLITMSLLFLFLFFFVFNKGY